MPQPQQNIDFFKILKRRKLSLILPAVIVFIVALIVAFVLPPIYKSSSTILIEQQEIPLDFVAATVTSFAEQRLQTINARIMSTTRLLEIINQMDLYKELRKKRTVEEIIEKMREDVELQPISVNAVDQRTGRSGLVTIAFSLSYEGSDSPKRIQQVVNLLVSLFLEENLKVRERQTTETFEFLDDEAARVKGDLDAISAKIADFKKKHIHELPEFMQVNLNNIDQTERDIQGLQIQLQSLRQQEKDLLGEISGIPPRLSDDSELKKLEEMKSALIVLSSSYSDEYPDVIRLKGQIRELESRLKEKDQQGTADAAKADNPVYLNIESRLRQAQNDTEIIQSRIVELNIKIQEYRDRVEKTAKIQAEYDTLETERHTSQLKHNDLLGKTMEAKVAQGLEKEQKGEKFTLLDPASFPEKPFKPNRLAIGLIGLVLGIGSGIAFTAVRETMDTTVKDAWGLAMTAPLPVLAEIPVIITPEEIRKKRSRRTAASISAVVAMISGIILFHFLVMDLNVFWAKAQRRIASGFSINM